MGAARRDRTITRDGVTGYRREFLGINDACELLRARKNALKTAKNYFCHIVTITI
jgi:hypothetical protein